MSTLEIKKIVTLYLTLITNDNGNYKNAKSKSKYLLPLAVEKTRYSAINGFRNINIKMFKKYLRNYFKDFYNYD